MAEESSVSRSPRLAIIAGATGTGKSTLAHMIAHELGFSRCVSTDTIREVLRCTHTAKHSPELHRSSYSQGETGDPVNDWLDSSEAIEKGINAVINRARSQGVDLVIEGVHIVPKSSWLRDWREAGGRAIGIFATVDAENQHREFILKREADTYRGPDRYLLGFDRIRAIQRAIMERGRVSDWVRIDPLLHDEPLLRIRQNLN
jgi:2-phosphoglycerate kinase